MQKQVKRHKKFIKQEQNKSSYSWLCTFIIHNRPPYCATVNTSVHHISAFLLSLLYVFWLKTRFKEGTACCFGCWNVVFIGCPTSPQVALACPQQCIGQTSHFSKNRHCTLYRPLSSLTFALSFTPSFAYIQTQLQHHHTQNDTHVHINILNIQLNNCTVNLWASSLLFWASWTGFIPQSQTWPSFWDSQRHILAGQPSGMTGAAGGWQWGCPANSPQSVAARWSGRHS